MNPQTSGPILAVLPGNLAVRIAPSSPVKDALKARAVEWNEKSGNKVLLFNAETGYNKTIKRRDDYGAGGRTADASSGEGI